MSPHPRPFRASHTSGSRARRRGVAAALLAVGLLGACSQDPLPSPAAVDTEQTGPALSVQSATNVLADIGETLDAADAARDPALLEPRVTEPAAGMRTGQYHVADLTQDRLTPPAISTVPRTVYVPHTSPHPRTLMSVSEAPQDGNLPQLLALQQAGARDPYKLWGWAELFPGVTVPALPSPEVGARTLAPDAQGLAATPTDALARYAATLEDTGGADAGAFTPPENDPFKERHRRLEDGLGPQLLAAGNVESTANPASSSPVALETADGGALVMGQVTTTETIRRTTAGSQIDLSGDYVDFLEGNGSVVGSVTFTYGTTLALHVPRADAEDPTIQVLGATTTLLGAQRDDASNPDN